MSFHESKESALDPLTSAAVTRNYCKIKPFACRFAGFTREIWFI